ncbi:MAG: response regulator transcription factor [Treponema sp.]|jgi:DNA-binding response OmpR family regulator|nr:response regulator transcription factor [Treponema sp.]
MNNKPLVLVVDDEPKILELIKSYLDASGFRGICAGTAAEGIAVFERETPALILLDLMLPDLSGGEFCKKIRQVSAVPIIMITARADEESIIHGLAIGADDYVTKPFSPRQLMARVKAALRRGGGNAEGALLKSGGLTVDTDQCRVKLHNADITLTRDEYKILTLLMSRPVKIFTRDEIIDHVKGGEYDGFDRAIDTHIKKIRHKIGDDPKSPAYIQTVYGMGYRFVGAEG